MRKLHFEMERSMIHGSHDSAFLLDGESTIEALHIAIWDAVRLDVYVTIGDHTAPAALWEDPEHWAEDWAELLSISLDEAPEAVFAILADAITENT